MLGMVSERRGLTVTLVIFILNVMAGHWKCVYESYTGVRFMTIVILSCVQISIQNTLGITI